MSQAFELSAELRKDVGKGASRRLRREQNLVPAIIYGGKKDPELLVIPANKVKKAIENEAFFSHILTIDVAGDKQTAVIKDMQRHPARGDVLHMDFLRVSASEVITMHVPLHFINEDKAPGVKSGGVIGHTITDLEIKCKASALPEYIEVDLSNLELDGSIHLSEIKLPAGVELAHEIDDEHDQSVVSIHVPRAVVEETPVAAEEAAAEGEEGADAAAEDSEEKKDDTE